MVRQHDYIILNIITSSYAKNEIRKNWKKQKGDPWKNGKKPKGGGTLGKSKIFRFFFRIGKHFFEV